MFNYGIGGHRFHIGLWLKWNFIDWNDLKWPLKLKKYDRQKYWTIHFLKFLKFINCIEFKRKKEFSDNHVDHKNPNNLKKKYFNIRIKSAEMHLWELILTATLVYERFSNIRSTNFPGLHFSPKISGHNSRNYGIWKAERYSISMDCQMNFRMFPFDHQLCPLMLESYSYSNDEVVFQWDENYATPIEYSDKIEVNDLEQGPKFTRPNCIVEYSTGNYSCLRVGSKVNLHKNLLKTCIKWEFRN